MAANLGRFVDRSPLICAAGMSSDQLDREEGDILHYQRDDSVGERAKENALQDDARFTQKNVDTESYSVPPELIGNISLLEAETEIQLLKDLAEKEVEELIHLEHLDEANSKDFLHSHDVDSVTALMHPPRTPYQVMWDSQVGHERYLTTHDDYNAPKKNETGVPAFEPEKCLNAAGKYNSRGIWVRCLCDWHKEEAENLSSEIEANNFGRYKPQVEKSLSPNHNIESVSKGFALRAPTRPESCDIEELMKDSDCVFRRDFYKWMASLTECRNTLREGEFDFKKFYMTLLKHDKENTGFLPVEEFFDICAQEHITFHKEEIEALLKVLKIIIDDKIDYWKFIEIIDVNVPTIDIVPFHDLPKHNQYYETSSQAADYFITNTAVDSVTALMHPPRTPYQIMWDSQVGHERYRTTYDDYNAPKKIEKGVTAFEPEKCLNAAGKYNSRGIWVRCMCDWHKKEAENLSSEIEAHYVDRYKPQIGKSLSPNHNIGSVPKGFAFGTPAHHESSNMEELMKDFDCPPCVFRRDFYKWMASLNKCRNALRERDFDFKKFYTTLLKHDKENTGFLPVEEVYELCAQEHITFHKEEIEALLNVLKIIVDDKIDYGRFIEIIDVNMPAIDIVPFHDLPKHNQYYETSNQAADYFITSTADLPAARLTSAHSAFTK